MNAAGLAMMLLSYAVVIALVVYCFAKVLLGGPPENPHPDASTLPHDRRPG